MWDCRAQTGDKMAQLMIFSGFYEGKGLWSDIEIRQYNGIKKSFHERKNV